MELTDFYRVFAPFYDADYKELQPEGVKFYVDLARQAGGPVLEMGCGTGRVLLPTARVGVPITGMELSPDMLGVLRRSLEAEPAEVRGRVTLVEGDARRTDAGKRFSLVTAPFRVAQHLLERRPARLVAQRQAPPVTRGLALLRCLPVQSPLPDRGRSNPPRHRTP